MDPFSIVAGSVGLLSGITSLTQALVPFIRDVRDARGDMNIIRTELYSLSLCVEGLKDDASDSALQFPAEIGDTLREVLANCNGVVTRMADLLNKYSTASARRRVQWATFGRGDMNNLRSQLEAHKTALNLGLSMTSHMLLTKVESDTTVIKSSTSAIKADTSAIRFDTSELQQRTLDIAAELASLKGRISQHELSQPGADTSFVLQRFLEHSTVYAESNIGETDLSYQLELLETTAPLPEALEDPSTNSLHKALEGGDDDINSSTTTDLARAGRGASEHDDGRVSTQSSALNVNGSFAVNTQPLEASPKHGDFSSMTKAESPIASNPAENLLDSMQQISVRSERAKNARAARESLTQAARTELDLKLQDALTVNFSADGVTHAQHKAIQKALEQGADPNQIPGHSTKFLHRCRMMSRFPEVVKHHEEFVDVMWSPLFVALTVGHKASSHEVVSILLEFGADPSQTISRDIGPALALALRQCSQPTIKALLDAGADLNVTFKAKEAGLGEPAFIFTSPLYTATGYCGVDIIRLLLERGANPNVTKDHDMSPLHLAALCNFGAIELLLNHGADIHAKSCNGQTPLHTAGSFNNEEHARLLVLRGADLNCRDAERASPLMLSARWNSVSTMGYLIEAGAEINLVSEHLGTALHVAAFWSKLAAVMMLLVKGADPNIIAGSYITPFIAAKGRLSAADPNIRAQLIKYGARQKLDGELFAKALVDSDHNVDGQIVEKQIKRAARALNDDNYLLAISTLKRIQKTKFTKLQRDLSEARRLYKEQRHAKRKWHAKRN